MRLRLVLAAAVVMAGCSRPARRPRRSRGPAKPASETERPARAEPMKGEEMSKENGADFYVATDGDDAWSGRLPSPNAAGTDGPFETLARARDAVLELKAKPGHEGPYVVMVRGGMYFLKEPLALGPDDSGTAERPVIYCAYPGEEVTLSGGRLVTGWRKWKNRIWVADVPDAGAGKGHFRQLFVRGERQTRARTPNFDPANPTTGGWSFVQEFGDPAKGSFGTSLTRIHTGGDTFLWKVDVPADGDYALWFYYGANNKPFGRDRMDDRTTMRIDGGEPVYLKNLPDTGGWDRFEWNRTATLRLRKGERRLRWTNVKGGGLNFDAFALSDDPGWRPKGKKLGEPAAGKHVVLVQAETFVDAKSKELKVAKGRGAHYKNKFRFAPGDIEAWPRSSEPEIHIFPAWGWVNAILSVDRIDPEERVCYVKNRNCSQELRPGNRYFVENVFEALDAPGEWFLDSAGGRLYYRPKDAGFTGEDVVAPALDRVIDISGDDPGGKEGEIYQKREGVEAGGKAGPRFAEHIVIRGFTFRHTKYSLEMGSVYTPDDGTIWLRRARHCVIEDCRFLGVGGYAVRMSMLASDNHIIGNTVAEAGQGGVLMAGYEGATQPSRNVVAGNRIHHCGRIWKHVAGVYVTTGSGNRIAHNTITDMPRYGISLKSFRPGSASHRNTVEYNRILRTNLETNDTGAIETLGRDREDTGNVIGCNLILDVVGLKTSETGEMLTPYYTWGIYLDDYSSGTRVHGNIVARTFRGAIHVHLGRNNVFENNIFMDSREQQVEFNGREFMTKNRFVRNIVSHRSGRLIRISRYTKAVLSECEDNLYWHTGGERAGAAESATPEGTLEKWRAAGYDVKSIVADPMFVDPANDDYRLRPASPALGLGFKQTDVTKIGVRGYRRPEGLP